MGTDGRFGLKLEVPHPLRLKQKVVTRDLVKDSCKCGIKLQERKTDGLDFLVKSEANLSAEGIFICWPSYMTKFHT